MSAADYVFDNADSIAGQRLQLLAEIFDPVSHACFERIGVAPGWSCWEVGAGYGTIAQWLHERVAPEALPDRGEPASHRAHAGAREGE